MTRHEKHVKHAAHVQHMRKVQKGTNAAGGAVLTTPIEGGSTSGRQSSTGIPLLDNQYEDSSGVIRDKVTGDKIVSGRTKAARAQSAMIHRVLYIGGAFVVIIGAIYLIRRYKLLSGGK